MALGYKARRRWVLVILLIGLPVYIVAAVTILDALDRPAFWVEVLIYAALGVLWAVPFRAMFRGIGQAEQRGDGPRIDR